MNIDNIYIPNDETISDIQPIDGINSDNEHETYYIMLTLEGNQYLYSSDGCYLDKLN